MEHQECQRIAYNSTDVIAETGLYAGSKKELKRLAEQGGIEVNEQRIADPQVALDLNQTSVVRVGKRLFFRIRAE